MIQGIYVRSFLLPDGKGSSRKSTETVALGKLVTSLDSHSCQPVSINFTRPLDYSNISPDMLSEKTVYVEVTDTAFAHWVIQYSFMTNIVTFRCA